MSEQLVAGPALAVIARRAVESESASRGSCGKNIYTDEELKASKARRLLAIEHVIATGTPDYALQLQHQR